MHINQVVEVGNAYGQVTVIARLAGQKRNVRVQCICGQKFDTYTYNLTNGTTIRCRGCANAARRGRPNLANRIDPKQRTINDLWNRVKKNLRAKPGSTLTKEQWFNIVITDCAYCGRPPSNLMRAVVDHAFDFMYNGVDRIDSSLPYVIENVQAACWPCNRMKGNMSHDEFLTHVELIQNYCSGNRTPGGRL